MDLYKLPVHEIDACQCQFFKNFRNIASEIFEQYEKIKDDNEFIKQDNDFIEEQDQTIQIQIQETSDKKQDSDQLLTWDYKFSDQNIRDLKLIDINDQQKIVCGQKCLLTKKIYSQNEIPLESGSYYWEIYRDHIKGCYDSVGVTTHSILNSKRNGMDNQGWSVRLYGYHKDNAFSGAIHNNISQTFFDKWQEKCTIGLLYQPKQNSLSYFHNGEYIGTPFKNVNLEKKKLYFVVEGCHLGFFESRRNVQLPSHHELSKIPAQTQNIQLIQQIQQIQQIQRNAFKSFSNTFGQDVSDQAVSLWKYDFDPQMCINLILTGQNRNIICGSKCLLNKRIYSKQKVPNDLISYWEIFRCHDKGCYDSLGVTTNHSQTFLKNDKLRNGDGPDGWAVRLYGKHQDYRFTGAIHNGNSKDFFNDWQKNDTIGLLYNPHKKTLSYFQNGKYIGTPFDNVQGSDLWFLVEGCHLGGYKNQQDQQLPLQNQIDKIYQTS